MKLGLAAWHYPHRTIIENILFFGNKGFDSISFNGGSILNALEVNGDEVAAALRQTGLILTLHFAFPSTHTEEEIGRFKDGIVTFGNWQNKHGLVENITFDVPDGVRDNVCPYIDFVLRQMPRCRVGLEDFGLNETELKQLGKYAAEERFGYLVDIGHLYLRLCGNVENGPTLFTHAAFEGAVNPAPDADDFYRAFQSKTYPIIEMHLHNNDGKNDSHLFLEDGNADINAIAAALMRLGYDGIVTIESAPGYQFPCYNEDADRGILKTVDFWQSCLQRFSL